MTHENVETRIHWIDNLRALACMMVIMIHTTTFYVTQGLEVGEYNWLLANVLNSASRVAVPLFFMISGFLFFGHRPAGKKQLLRMACCLLFYSLVALLYMALLTPISALGALGSLLQKPAFYHLWFFYAVMVIYLLSPLIQIRPVSAGYIAVSILLLAVIANPNTVVFHWGNVMLWPINLFIGGDTFYYVLYAVLGRAIGMLTFQGRKIPIIAVSVFIISVALVAMGTKKQLIINGDFADTYYLYCGPLVFIGAVALFVFFKQACCHRSYPGLRLISRYSLAIYGFHAFIIHFIRTHGLDDKSHPAMDMLSIFVVTLALSLLLAMGLSKIDRRRWVS